VPYEFLTNGVSVKLKEPYKTVVAFKAFQALLITNIGKIAENRGARINVGIVLDVSLLVHQPLWSRRTAAVSCFASRRPSI